MNLKFCKWNQWMIDVKKKKRNSFSTFFFLNIEKYCLYHVRMLFKKGLNQILFCTVNMPMSTDIKFSMHESLSPQIWNAFVHDRYTWASMHAHMEYFCNCLKQTFLWHWT